MRDKTDAELLRQYYHANSEAAFGEIVARHTDFVYSVALRSVRSSDVACDIAQGVFTDLARKARGLTETTTDRASLAGWLYRSTRYAVLNQIRDEQRRLAHERQAMEELLSHSGGDGASDWSRIQSLLDEAMDDLKEEDREALLLRYFKNQDFRAIGRALGVSDDTAQKRVSRAVGRLRDYLDARGVTLGASGIVTAISANAVQAAPAGLAASISAGVLAAAKLAGASSAVAASTATKTIAMTTLQKVIATALLTAAVGTVAYKQRQVSHLSAKVNSMRMEQAPIAARLADLAKENQRLSNVVMELRSSQSQSQTQFAELMKLRGKAGLSQQYSQEIAKLKSLLAREKSNKAASVPIKRFYQNDPSERLGRMRSFLHLTDDQVEVIRLIMTNQMTSEMMSARSTREQKLRPEATAEIDPESDIKAVLNPEQLAAYPEYQKSERSEVAGLVARSYSQQLAEEFDLAPGKAEALRSSLYELESESANSSLVAAVRRAKLSGNTSDLVNLCLELQESKIEQRIKAIQPFLTPEQLEAYRDQQNEQVGRYSKIVKAEYTKNKN
jgi:RNA polymerase sigma factor (sigma-70 family)